MLAEIVAEQVRVAVVRSPLDAYVHVSPALAFVCLEKALLPFASAGVRAGRTMTLDRAELDEAGAAERIRIGQVRNGDLHVDPILCGQSRDGRRADVVDAQRMLPEHRPESPREPREVPRPSFRVRLDRHANHSQSLPRDGDGPRGRFGAPPSRWASTSRFASC